jgi:hypothetical protein
MHPEQPVWYVAYGSNLRRARFEAYVHGGTVEGASRVYPGCRSGAPSSGEAPVTIRHRLAFGRYSPNWGGGVAFIDPNRDESVTTIGRAWRIGAQQLGDVIAQENGSSTHDPDPEWLDLDIGGAAHGPFGWYGAVVRCDDVAGEPAFTVTSGNWPIESNPPTVEYLAHVRIGLHELGHDEVVVDRYLAVVTDGLA